MTRSPQKAKRPAERVAGIDVSAKTLHVTLRTLSGTTTAFEVTNDAAGHASLVRSLTDGGKPARVVMEATGIYSLDAALALTCAKVRVMVANPRATHDFISATMSRAKTDRLDSMALLEFAERMEFVLWTPPAAGRVALRSYARRIHDLTIQHTAEANRLHCALTTATTPKAIVDDIRAGMAALDQRTEALITAAAELMMADPEIAPAFQHVQSVKGIATKSAIAILGELLVLPADMTSSQVVAHAGLAPRPRESGTSVKGRRSISKVGNARLRGALYMPTLVAVQHCPPLRELYQRHLARGKAKMVALVAVSRRLLETLWQMIRTDTDFDPARFAPLRAAVTAPV